MCVEDISKKAFPVGVPSFVLAFVGAIKLLSLGSASPILGMRDQLFGVEYSQLFFWLGLLEFGAGMLSAVVLPRSFASVSLLGFGVLFLTYRLFVLATGANQFCPCLGSAVDWIPGLAAYQDRLLTGIALWLCLTGLWSVWSTE